MPTPITATTLLHRDGLGEVAWLVDVVAHPARELAREQLQRHDRDQQLRRMVLLTYFVQLVFTDEAVPYSRIALVDAADADDPGGDTLVLAGEAFELREQRDDLLLRLDAGTVDARPATIDQVWPSLLIVTEGTSPCSPRRQG